MTTERLDVLEQIRCVIAQDAAHEVEVMVGEGWDRGQAVEAVTWWWRHVVDDALERLDW